MKFVNKALLLQSEVKNTNFTKKIPKAIIAVCGVALMEIATPITAFADNGTESIDTFENWCCCCNGWWRNVCVGLAKRGFGRKE